ncbi:MAG TPA: hypothetical protein VFQ43_16280, partial [Nitrososphaera sp.]|nr:hypothetical protein [Nitrososphaera sp.]
RSSAPSFRTHIANCFFCCFMTLIQKFFDLQLHSSDAVSFIPVYLSAIYRATSQPHSGCSFEFRAIVKKCGIEN